MSDRGNGRRWLNALPYVAVLWLFIVGLLLLQLWPDLPKSKMQWALLIGLGPPFYVLGEEFCGWFLSKKHGEAISRHGFSFKRILVALAVALPVISFCWWLSWLLTRP